LLPITSAADDWSATDQRLEAAYLTLHLVDWSQTRHTARNPALFRECNPFLPEHPSIGQVDRYFIGTALLHVLIADALPEDWRRGFQVGTIGMEFYATSYNFSVGIKARF